MTSFSNRDKERNDSNAINLSEGTMPSGHKPSIFSRLADVFSKQRRDRNFVENTLNDLRKEEVRLTESIESLKEQLKTLDAKLRKQDELLQTLARDTPVWENCLADMEELLDKERNLTKVLGACRERLSNARRFIWKMEEGKFVDEPLLRDAERLLVILKQQTVDIETNRRQEAEYVKQLEHMGIRGSNKARAKPSEIYERIRVRRGENASESPADVSSLEALRSRRRLAE